MWAAGYLAPVPRRLPRQLSALVLASPAAHNSLTHRQGETRPIQMTFSLGSVAVRANRAQAKDLILLRAAANSAPGGGNEWNVFAWCRKGDDPVAHLPAASVTVTTPTRRQCRVQPPAMSRSGTPMWGVAGYAVCVPIQDVDAVCRHRRRGKGARLNCRPVAAQAVSARRSL